MAVTQLDPVLRHIRRMACSPGLGGPTDGQLLEQYLLDGSEAAFAALVRRHGPMVLGVCRRVLGNAPDADDAFQAAFLILIRKASRIVNRESVGSWLHGVAYRTALKAKTAGRRRRLVEQQAPVADAVEDIPAAIRRELRPILDEEIGRLPERYRLPVVLCYLEGKTNTEAAQLLRWPKGTVATRLARARERLRKRLTHRGVALSVGGLSAAALTGVPASLRASVMEAAKRVAAGKAVLTGVVSGQVAALAKGVLWNMGMTKMLWFTMVLLVIGLTGGASAGVLLYRTAGMKPPSASREVQSLKVAVDEKRETEMTHSREPNAEVKEKSITITCEVAEIKPDGKVDILSRPQMKALNNQTTWALVGENADMLSDKIEGDVERGDLYPGMKIAVTPVLLPDGRIEVQVVLIAAVFEELKEESLLARGYKGVWHKTIKFDETATLELAGRYRLKLTACAGPSKQDDRDANTELRPHPALPAATTEPVAEREALKTNRVETEKIGKAYQIDIVMIEVGKDGKERTIAAPKLLILGGILARFASGDTRSPFGLFPSESLSFTSGIKVIGRKDGQLQVDTFTTIRPPNVLEELEGWTLEGKPLMFTRVVKQEEQTVRCLKVIKDGDTIRFEMDHAEVGRHKLAFTVHEVPPQ